MSLAKTAIRQPVLVNLLSVLVLVAGAIYATANTKELYPDIEPPGVLVTAAYPGVSAEEVEKLVVRPIEDRVADLDGVAHIHSRAQDGLATLWVEFESGVNRDRAVLEVQRRVSEAEADLPEDAETPQVATASHMVPVIQVALTGPEGGDPAVLQRAAERLRDRLAALPGVAAVQAAGLRDRQVFVHVDPERLAALGLDLTDVSQAISARDRNLPGGTVRGSGTEWVLRARSEFADLEEIRQVVLRPGTTGDHIRVGDVAEVTEGLADRASGGWVDGEPAILFTVAKHTGADGHKVVAAVRAELDRARQWLPAGHATQTFGDTTRLVNRSLDTLYQNGLMGLVLVLALLWLFLGFRNALFAALGLPFALAGGLLVMYLLGVSINQLSLFALILCVGILVDDAIVVVENVARHRERGLSPRAAALLGTKEVLWPVSISVLTTIAAFLPMLLVSGPFGDFVGVIPKVVVAALSASLIEALFVLPSHLAEWPGRPTKTWASRALEGFARRVYRPSAAWVLRARWGVLPVALLAALGLGAGALARSEVALFSGGDGEQFDVRVRMPTGTRLEETERVLRRVAQAVRALPGQEVQAVLIQSGWSRTNLFPETGRHVGMVTVLLRPAGQRSRSTQEIMDALRSRVAAIPGPVQPPELVEGGFRPPTGDPVAIRLSGDDLDTLDSLARQVAETLGRVPGARDVNRDFRKGNTALDLRVDEARAALYGLSAARVARALYLAHQGHRVSHLRRGDERLDVVVRLPGAVRLDPSRVGDLSLRLPNARSTPPSALGHELPRVRLNEVAHLERTLTPATILRRDRKRTVTVTARLRPGATSDGVNRAARAQLAGLMAEHPEVRFSFGGEFERLDESTQDLFRAFGVALLVIYLLLAAQFRSFLQPAVVLVALPLAGLGVSIGFLVGDGIISFVALLGLVGLAGIVVNDSLVLVDFVNQRRRAGRDRRGALLEAGETRLRPILLTSVTTLAGLLPMSLGLFGGSGGLEPMATAMVWGLSFSTVLTIYLVPAAYAVVDDVAALARRSLGRLVGLGPKEPPSEAEEAALDALDRLPLAEALRQTEPQNP